jgi:hypothetical protein
VRDVGVPTLVGAVLRGPGEKVSNAGIVWDPETGPGERYVKRHPVPFGEYIPYRSLVRQVTSRVDLVPRDFAAGEQPGVLAVGPAAGQRHLLRGGVRRPGGGTWSPEEQADRRADTTTRPSGAAARPSSTGDEPPARRRARRTVLVPPEAASAP